MNRETIIKLVQPSEGDMKYTMVGDMDLLARMVWSAMEDNAQIAKVMLAAVSQYMAAESIVTQPISNRSN